ncbi:MAG: CFI-box-CTERM domain-containing protein [Candidatus Bathyarchaeia archaeon]
MGGGGLKVSAAVLILIGLAMASSLKASSSNDVPFKDLRLLYDLNLPILTLSPPSSFKGTVEFTFMNLSSDSASVKVILDGELIAGAESRDVKMNGTVTIPIGVNTLLYLKPNGEPGFEGGAEIIGLPLDLDGYQIFLGGIFRCEGEIPIVTPAGRFTTYRFRNETSISNLVLETSLHYDKYSRVMIYAELKARSGFHTYSYTMKLVETNMPQEAQPSPCLIATAAYASPMDPKVQELRSFRDDIVLKTRLGSAFMECFNAWYYSFSPYIAEAERRCEPLRLGLRTILIPLIEILKVSRHIYGAVPSTLELNLILMGLTASAMIGAVYLSPILALTLHRRRGVGRGVSKAAAYLTVFSTICLTAGAATGRTPPPWLGILSSITVISSLTAGGALAAEAALLVVDKSIGDSREYRCDS